MVVEANGLPSRPLDLAVIARNLRLLMADRGWNQVELSEAAKVSATTVSRYVRGQVPNPRATEARNIAGAFGLSLDDLNRPMVVIYAEQPNGHNGHNGHDA